MGLSELDIYASDPNMILVSSLHIMTVYGIDKDGKIQDPTFHIDFIGMRNDADNHVAATSMVSLSIDAAIGLVETLNKALMDLHTALDKRQEGGE